MNNEFLPPDLIETQVIVNAALREDLRGGDTTSGLLVPDAQNATLQFVAREEMVACGMSVALLVAQTVSMQVEPVQAVAEGARVMPGEALLALRGNARALLGAERTALNLMQRMCGVATLTRHYVQAMQGANVALMDTRKTMPGLRELDKYAVRVGGGVNHRMNLAEMVFIKDNHIALCGGVREAIARAKAGTNLPIEVECDTLAQVEEAASTGVDRILLDNMPFEHMRRAVEIVAGRAHLEASGNVTLETIAQIAQTGVQSISVGRITHSARSVDISAEIVFVD